MNLNILKGSLNLSNFTLEKALSAEKLMYIQIISINMLIYQVCYKVKFSKRTQEK